MNNTLEERLIRAEEEEEEDVGDLKRMYWIETKEMWRIAFPTMLARVSAFGIMVVTQSYIGHISSLDLAGYALVQTLTVRFVNGILLGMASATETLCGQAFGAGQYHMMGIYLQRSWVVEVITAAFLLPLFIFAVPIFRLLGEQEAIATEAGKMSLWFIPFIYNNLFMTTIQMFLQAQLKNMVVGWLSTLSFLFHLVLSWIFVIKLNWGVNGAMAALIASPWLMIVGECVYVFGGWCPHSWRGFTVAAFHDLWPVIKLSLSAAVMICLEFWYNSVLLLAAGYMENAEVEIAAFSICLNITGWEFMLFLGFLGSACVRVANELGRGNAKAAKFSIKVVITNSIAIGLIFFIICIVFGRDIPYFFTNDKQVAQTVSDLSVPLAITMFLNSIYPVLTGVAVGAGWQSMVAVVNLCCYYFIGLPIGLLLAYVAHLQVKGLWIGMICGVVTQSLALAFMTWRTDWDEQVNKTSAHLNRWFLKSKEESNGSTNDA